MKHGRNAGPHHGRMGYLSVGNGQHAETPPTGYLPIEEHGIVGDLRTVALVGTDGTVDWYCPSRFDAPSLFGALLDARNGGTSHCRAGPAGGRSSSTCRTPTSC